MGTSEQLVFAVLEAREAHPRWGPKKLVELLKRRYKSETPSRATIARILQRFGKVHRRRRRAPLSVVEQAPDLRPKTSNEVWSVDFKGWWNARDGSRSEPLTVRDGFSRFVLCAKLLEKLGLEAVRTEFERLFRRYGIPSALQCDNGQPFISIQSRGGLTRLSAWWVELGIRVIRSRPGCPQDNGAHERMHRDIAADVQAFPNASRIADQRALDRWKQEFNHVRPHEALGGKTPAELYRPGKRRTLKPAPHEYPSTWMTRRAYAPDGRLLIHGEIILIGRPFIGHRVGLEPVTDRTARLWLRGVDLGELQIPPDLARIDATCVRYVNRKRKAS
jgi:transposase InsO family protein